MNEGRNTDRECRRPSNTKESLGINNFSIDTRVLPRLLIKMGTRVCTCIYTHIHAPPCTHNTCITELLSARDTDYFPDFPAISTGESSRSRDLRSDPSPHRRDTPISRPAFPRKRVFPDFPARLPRARRITIAFDDRSFPDVVAASGDPDGTAVGKNRPALSARARRFSLSS